jgi:hypothetical protein
MVVTNQNGMALVTALLYMLVITFLVVCAFSTSALQTKISAHFNEEKQAFEYAESALLAGEEKINPDEKEGRGNIDTHARYTFRRWISSQCGLFYQVDAMGMIRAKVHLQSIFIFPYRGENPCKDPTLKARRVVWQQING